MGQLGRCGLCTASRTHGGAPLSELNLAGTNLCVTGLGLHTTDALEIVARFVRASGALRKLNLQGTHLCGSTHDPANGYTLAGLTLLCDALARGSTSSCAVESTLLTAGETVTRALHSSGFGRPLAYAAKQRARLSEGRLS